MNRLATFTRSRKQIFGIMYAVRPRKVRISVRLPPAHAFVHDYTACAHCDIWRNYCKYRDKYVLDDKMNAAL